MLEELSLTGARWERVPYSEDALEVPSDASNAARVAATMLSTRRGTQPAGDWLAPSLDHLHDPYKMHGMEAAVERLQRAVRDREKVRIITDYDVDGTTSSLVLQAVLRILEPELELDFHIPHRFSEGYGFSVIAAERAADDGVQLIVTADIGVRDHAAVSAAAARGVDVLVCDHHLPAGESVPADALVLCPPQADCNYPNPSLCACGVSLKLAQAMLADHPKGDRIVRSLLKLAAIGTVADLVPLTTLENRAIVHHGLRALNQDRHAPGLAALLRVAGLSPGQIRESDLGYRVGPRINAAGRVDDATLVVRLLSTRDPSEANALAEQLDKLNDERRRIQQRLVREAQRAVGSDPASFVVVAGPEEEGWHRGVVGIVASRLKDDLNRPVAVVSIQGDRAVGSIRSVPGIHAVKALNSADDLLVKYGGHPAAAGFTVPTEHLEALKERLASWVDNSATDIDNAPVHRIDAEVDAEDLNEELLTELSRIGPFGMGNPTPRLMVRGVRARGIEKRGKDKRLLRCMVSRQHGPDVEAIWWDGAGLATTFKDQRLDLLGSLELHVWRGRSRLQFKLTDARLSSL